MRGRFIIGIFLQVVLLLGILGYRHYWVSTGEKIFLRTTPVDPRDLFRGDYVRLAYEISILDLEKLGTQDDFKSNEYIYLALEHDTDGTMKWSSIHKSRPSVPTFIRGRVKYRASEHRIWEITFRDETGGVHTLSSGVLTGVHQGSQSTLCVDGRGHVTQHFKDEEVSRKKECWSGRKMAGTVERIAERKTRPLHVDYGIESFFVQEGKGREIEAARNVRQLKVEVSLNRDGQAVIRSLRIDGRVIE